MLVQKLKTVWPGRVLFFYVLVLLAGAALVLSRTTPFMTLTLSGYHNTKYVNYAGQALNMVAKDDPFVLQSYYGERITENATGINSRSAILPLMSWHLYPLYKYFGFSEVLTRLPALLYGLFALVAAFFVSYRVSSSIAYSATVVLLLATAPVFLFSSFLLIPDTPMVLFTLVAFIFMSQYVSVGGQHNLRRAGFFGGLAFLFKFSALLIALPLFSLMICCSRGSRQRGLLSMASFWFYYFLLFFATLPIGMFLFNQNLGLASIVKAAIAVILATALAFAYFRPSPKTASRRTQLAYVGAYLLAIPVFVLSANETAVTQYLEFVTYEPALLLSSEFFRELLERAKPLVSESVFGVAVLGLFLAVRLRFRRFNNRALLFLAGAAAFYVVFSSKLIYFHEYYMLFPAIVVAMLVALPVYFLGLMFGGTTHASAVLERRTTVATLLLVALILPFLIASNKAKTEQLLSKNRRGLHQTAQFISSNTNRGDPILVDEAFEVTLYSGRFGSRPLDVRALDIDRLRFFVVYGEPRWTEYFVPADARFNRKDIILDNLAGVEREHKTKIGDTKRFFRHIRSYGDYHIYAKRRRG